MTALAQQPAANVASRDDLRALFQWPSEPPNVSPFMHGWFFGQDILPYFCGPQTNLIVELGSWLGKSARWFCNHCPNATVVCIDHWHGSPEFASRWDMIVPKSFDLFQLNLWQHRHRVVPLKMSSVEGVGLLEYVGAKPDLVFIDAGHSREDVFADVTACRRAFPDSQLVGDDWNWKSVQEGLSDTGIATANDEGRFWWTV